MCVSCSFFVPLEPYNFDWKNTRKVLRIFQHCICVREKVVVSRFFVQFFPRFSHEHFSIVFLVVCFSLWCNRKTCNFSSALLLPFYEKFKNEKLLFFLQTFNSFSPCTWMTQRRGKNIFQELNSGKKNVEKWKILCSAEHGLWEMNWNQGTWLSHTCVIAMKTCFSHENSGSIFFSPFFSSPQRKSNVMEAKLARKLQTLFTSQLVLVYIAFPHSYNRPVVFLFFFYQTSIFTMWDEMPLDSLRRTEPVS